MVTPNCAIRADARMLSARYRSEKSDKKSEFWANMFNIWHMFKWRYPDYSLRDFSEYFDLPLSTVSRRFSNIIIMVLSGEKSRCLNQSTLINETLDNLANDNDWHTIRLIWLYESARLQITKRQFCERYGLTYNTVRPHLAEGVLDGMWFLPKFHRYVFFDREDGWLVPDSEPARKPGLISRVLSEFRDNWA